MCLKKIKSNLITLVMILCLLFITFFSGRTFAYDLKSTLKDISSISAAYSTHLFLHELGHQIVADEVGAKNHSIQFFTTKDGKFYPGLSTYQNIPKDSKLPYATGGERMAGVTFEYALSSYRKNPNTFNKALLFFSNFDFLIYTLMGNYIEPHNDMYDPNLIRAETDCSKETLLGLVALKSLINTYRIFHEDINIIPVVDVDKHAAYFMLRFNWD
jgi:hypothetical protein